MPALKLFDGEVVTRLLHLSAARLKLCPDTIRVRVGVRMHSLRG